MLIMTAKLSKGKIFLALAVAAVLLFLVLRLVSGGDDAPTVEGDTALPTEVSSNEERLTYLKACGYAADPEPIQTQEVSIPKEFNEVFTRYNELQQSQGFDLSDYAGKPDGEGVHATLIVYQDRVIAADLSCTEGEGFMRPLLPKTGA